MVGCRGHKQLQGPTPSAKGSKVGILINMMSPTSSPGNTTELISPSRASTNSLCMCPTLLRKPFSYPELSANLVPFLALI